MGRLRKFFKKKKPAKQVESERRINFQLGKPCSDCCKKVMIKGFFEADKRRSKIKAFLRCSNCLDIKCLNKTCSEDKDCHVLNERIKTELSDVRNIIWKKLSDNRHSCLNFVSERSFTSERIHEVDLEIEIVLSKSVRAADKSEKKKCNNYIRIRIIRNDGKDDINVNVRLQERAAFTPVALYQKGGTEMELKFIRSFEENLATTAAMVSKPNDILEYLEKADGPAVIVCLHQSRIQEDIRYTLGNVREKFYNRLILVLLHFKTNDRVYLAADIQQRFPNLRIIDYFQHQEIENIEEVMKNVKAIIFSD